MMIVKGLEDQFCVDKTKPVHSGFVGIMMTDEYFSVNSGLDHEFMEHVHTKYMHISNKQPITDNLRFMSPERHRVIHFSFLPKINTNINKDQI